MLDCSLPDEKLVILLETPNLTAYAPLWFDKPVLSSDFIESHDIVGPAEGLTTSRFYAAGISPLPKGELSLTPGPSPRGRGETDSDTSGEVGVRVLPPTGSPPLRETTHTHW